MQDDLKLGQRASKAEPWEGLPMLCTGLSAELDIAESSVLLSEKDTHTHFHLTAHELSLF